MSRGESLSLRRIMLCTRRNQIREEYTCGPPDRLKCIGHRLKSRRQECGRKKYESTEHNNPLRSRRRIYYILMVPDTKLTREVRCGVYVRLCGHRQLADACSDRFAGGGAGNVTIGEEVAHYERFLIFQRHA